MIVGCAVVMQRSDAVEEADFTSEGELQEIAGNLRSMGHSAVPIDVSAPLGLIVDTIERVKPDVVLNTIELVRGEVRPSGVVPTICGLLGVPCTGPDSASIAVGANKWLTKRTVAPGAVRFAPDLLLRPGERWDPSEFHGTYPVLVKPNFGGSSQGIDAQSLARTPDEVAEALLRPGTFLRAGTLIESFIRGQDLTVGCIEVDGRWHVMTPIRYSTPATNGEHFMTRSLKTWAEWDQVRHEPVGLSPLQHRDLEAFTLELVRSVGARGVARVDLRLSDEDGKLYVLEINAIAGMEEESGLSRSATASGMDHRQMLEHLLRSAAVRSTTLAH